MLQRRPKPLRETRAPSRTSSAGTDEAEVDHPRHPIRRARSSLEIDHFLASFAASVPNTMSMRRTRTGTLLAELHAHTTWSDGVLPSRRSWISTGSRGFDVLCITDHVCRSVRGAQWGHRSELRRLPRRHRTRGGTGPSSSTACWSSPASSCRTTTPTRNSRRTRSRSACVSFVSVDEGIDRAIETAVQAGAALVAAHPFDDEPADNPGRLTQRFARDPELSSRVHRLELFNRMQLFSWVAKAGLPCVASGDFHRLEHLRRLEERRPMRTRRGGADRAPALAPARLHHPVGAEAERAAA